MSLHRDKARGVFISGFSITIFCRQRPPSSPDHRAFQIVFSNYNTVCPNEIIITTYYYFYPCYHAYAV